MSEEQEFLTALDAFIEKWWGRIEYEAESDELAEKMAAWWKLVDRLPDHELSPASPDKRPRRDVELEYLFRNLRYVRDDLARIIKTTGAETGALSG